MWSGRGRVARSGRATRRPVWSFASDPRPGSSASGSVRGPPVRVTACAARFVVNRRQPGRCRARHGRPTSTATDDTVPGSRRPDLVLHLHRLDGQQPVPCWTSVPTVTQTRATRPGILALTVCGPACPVAAARRVARSRSAARSADSAVTTMTQPSTVTSNRSRPAARSSAVGARRRRVGHGSAASCARAGRWPGPARRPGRRPRRARSSRSSAPSVMAIAPWLPGGRSRVQASSTVASP